MPDPPVPRLAAAVPAAGAGDWAGDTHGRRAEQPSPAAAPRNPWRQTNLFRPCDPVTQPAGGGNARDGKYPDCSEALDPARHQPPSSALMQPWARIRGEEEPCGAPAEGEGHRVSSALAQPWCPRQVLVTSSILEHRAGAESSRAAQPARKTRKGTPELCSRPGRETESGTAQRDGQRQSCPTQGRRGTRGTQRCSRNSPCHRTSKVRGGTLNLTSFHPLPGADTASTVPPAL